MKASRVLRGLLVQTCRAENSLYRPSSPFFRAAFSTTRTLASDQATSERAAAQFNPRLLSELKARIGKCILFGLSAEQSRAAGSILREIALDWRELTAGSEGYLTSRDRTGLFRRQVIWGEQDSMVSHVNNVTYIRYAETGRVNWAMNYATLIDPAHQKEWMELCSNRTDGFILRAITTEYKFPMQWPDHVTVYHKLRSLPSADTDDFKLDVLMLSERHRRPAARCVEDLVLYDYKKGKKTALKPFMRDEFQRTFKLQEEARATNQARVRNLLDRVRALEHDSWDRPDAVEDTGSVTK